MAIAKNIPQSNDPYQVYQQQKSKARTPVQHQQVGGYENLDANGQGQAQPTQGYLQQARNQGYAGEQFVPQWSDDPITQQKALSLAALQSGFSGQNQDQEAYNNLLRDTAAQKISALQGNQSQAANQLDTQLQRGFKTQAMQLARGASGAGTMGTVGYNQQANNLAQANSEARAKALLALQSQGTQELGALSGIGGQLGSQDLANRQQTYNQAKDLSALQGGYQAQDLSIRQAQEAQQRADSAAADAAKGKLLGALMTAGGAGAGALAGNPMAGAQIGNALGGGLGGQQQTFQQPMQYSQFNPAGYNSGVTPEQLAYLKSFGG